MLSAENKQFTLKEDGQVFYQENPTNPLPGVPVAQVRKGDSLLAPGIEARANADTANLDKTALQEKLNSWLTAHIVTVLEPLAALKNDETLTGPVAGICEKLHGAMGTIAREQVEDLITQLDPDARRVLRSKKIKLGPLLVFQPDLNKPAAVRLRGLLWNLFHGKPLPAPVPPDGIVSKKIEDGAEIDQDFYRSIGYPVYGPRTIRIDMLDRVINSIYDNAKGGQFQAKHQMAEWLGCPIDDLYAILHAMGHRKIEEEVKPVEAAVAPEQTAAEPAAAEETPAEPKPQVKPELAFFRLKKGKAFEQQAERPARPAFKKPEGGKPQQDRKPKPGKKDKHAEKPERIMQAGPKPRLEDSPFAILGQLKAGKDAG